MNFKTFVFILFFAIYAGQVLYAQSLSAGITFYESKKYDEAYKQLSTIAKSHPQYAESRYYLGLILMQKNEQSKAEEYLKQAVAANANDARYHYALATLYGQMAREANMVRQATLAGRVKTHLETAVKLDPKNMNASFMLVGLYSRAPRIMGGDPEKARKVANDMMKYNRAEGLRALGFVAQSEDKNQEAETHYKNALNASPDSLKYYQSLASFYQTTSKHDDALLVYERAISRFPADKNLNLQVGRAAALSGAKNTEKAKKYLNTWIAENKQGNERNLANAWYYLGLTEKNGNNLQVARNHFNAALKLNPEHKLAKEALKELNP